MAESERREFATKQEVADRYRVSVRTIDSWMKSRGMPFFKIGKAVRFCVHDTDEWFKAFKNN
jgi:excisionase family DNA binding protein